MKLDEILNEIESKEVKEVKETITKKPKRLMKYINDLVEIENVIGFTEYFKAPEPYGTKMVLKVYTPKGIEVVTIKDHIKYHGKIVQM